MTEVFNVCDCKNFCIIEVLGFTLRTRTSVDSKNPPTSISSVSATVSVSRIKVLRVIITKMD